MELLSGEAHPGQTFLEGGSRCSPVLSIAKALGIALRCLVKSTQLLYIVPTKEQLVP